MRTRWTILAVVCGVLAVAAIWLAAGMQNCGNVYRDVVDKDAALRVHDTVPSGIGRDGQVYVADSTRPYVRHCITSPRTATARGFAVAGILLAVGIVVWGVREKRQLDIAARMDDGWKPRNGYPPGTGLGPGVSNDPRSSPRG